MSQVQIPNSDHVFDELELIIFVSQGLTLSTASLVVVILIPVVVHDVEDGHDVTGSEADIIILSSNEGVVGKEIRRD